MGKGVWRCEILGGMRLRGIIGAFWFFGRSDSTGLVGCFRYRIYIQMH